MALHSIYLDDGLRSGELVIRGDEAHHAARVKRIQAGDSVRLLDGRGHTAVASVNSTGKSGRGEWMLTVRAGEIQEAPRPRPFLHVLSAVPKGSRLTDMIDGLSQAGAWSWAPLRTRRGENDAAASRLARLERTAAEASKQCGRAWRMLIEPEVDLVAALRAPRQRLVIADAAGSAYSASGPSSDQEISLLVGPEGGWTPEELSAAREAGAEVIRFGPYIMRIETAAVVAAGVIMSGAASNEPLPSDDRS